MQYSSQSPYGPQGYYYQGPYPQFYGLPQGYYYQDPYPQFYGLPQGYYYQGPYPQSPGSYPQLNKQSQSLYDEVINLQGEDIKSAPIDLTTQSSGFPDSMAFPYLSDHAIFSYGVCVKNSEGAILGKIKAYVWNRGNKGIQTSQGYYNNPWNVAENESQFQERMKQQYIKILYIIDKDPKASIFLLQESLDLYNGSAEFIQNLAERNWTVVLFDSKERIRFNAIIYNNLQMNLVSKRELDIYKINDINQRKPFCNTLIGNFRLSKFNDLEMEIGSIHLLRSKRTKSKVNGFIENFRCNPNTTYLFLGGDTNHFNSKKKYIQGLQTSQTSSELCSSTYYIGNSEFLDHIPILKNKIGLLVESSNRVNFSIGTLNPTIDSIMSITEKRFSSFSIKLKTNSEGEEGADIKQIQVHPKTDYPNNYRHISIDGLIKNERGVRTITF